MRAALVLATAVVAAIVLRAPVAEAGRGTQALRLLPDDTRAVVIIDVKRARSSAIFKKAFELASDKMSILERLDLDNNVDTIVAGTSGLSAQPFVVVVEGKLQALVPEIEKRATATAHHRGITYWTTPHGEVALVDNRLVVTSAGGMILALDRARDKKRTRGPASVRAIVAATTANAAIVGGIAPDAALKQDVAKELGSEPTLVTCSIGVGARLTLEGRFQFADAPAATKAGAAFERTLAGDARDRLEVIVGKEVADSISVDTDDAVTRISATMSADEVDRVLTMARMFM